MAESVITQVLQILGEDKSGAAFDSVQGRVEKLDVAFGVALGNIAVEGLKKLTEFAKSGFEAAVSLVDLSDRLGVSAGDMSVLSVAANKTHTDLDLLAKKTVVLAGVVQDALIGKVTDATKALHTLGITTAQLKAVQNDSVGQLKLFAAATAGLGDGALKSALFMNVFGKSAVELVPLMKDSGKAIEEATAEVDRMGSRISDFEAEKIRKADDRMREFTRTMEYVSRVAAIGFIDAFNKVDEKIGDVVMAMQLGINAKSGLPKARLEGEALRTALEGAAKTAGNFPQIHVRTPQEAAADRAAADALAADKAKTASDANKKFNDAMQRDFNVQVEQEAEKNTRIAADRATFNDEQLKKHNEFLKQQALDEQDMGDYLTELSFRQLAQKEKAQVDFLERTGVLTREQIQGLTTFSKDTLVDQAQTALGVAANLFGSLAGHSGKAFKLYQAFAIAEAVVSTAKAAIAGFAYGMENGGPYVAAALAASAIAAGVVQIAKIRSAQPGGGSAGGTGGGGGGVGVGSNSGGSTASATPVLPKGPSAATIILQGHTFSREAVLDLVEQINDVLGDGATLNIETRG